MIAGLKPYLVMKDSGVPWLGRIPENWGVLPGRACYREYKTPNTGLQESTVLSLSYGRIVIKPPDKLHGLVPASFETYQIIEPGDIVIRPTDLQNDWNSLRFGLSTHRGIITSAYLCFRPQRSVTNEYGHLLLHTYDLKKVFYGLGSGLRQNLDWTDFKYLPCVVPPLTEQAAIVRFLDHVDRRIRRYIRAKQRLIALLEEQKQAIIDRATTQGTDGAIPLKPSGVPWLGDIPRHWGVSRSRHLLSPRRQLALPDDVQLSSTQAYGVIPQAEYEQKVGRRVVKISLHLEKRRHVEQNDFVISMRSFQGGLERAWAAGAIRSSYVVLKPGPAVNVEYFEHLLKSKSYIRALQATADFIRDGQDLTYDDFKRVDLPLVPLEEQRGIAASVAKATAAIRVSMSRLEREVSLVGEYRTRLIADVVTGKFDVREAAARLPTETDEAEPPLAVDALEGVDGEGEGSELDAEGEGSADA